MSSLLSIDHLVESLTEDNSGFDNPYNQKDDWSSFVFRTANTNLGRIFVEFINKHVYITVYSTISDNPLESFARDYD